MRATSLLFGVACHAFFFLTFLYLIAFTDDLPFAPHRHPRAGRANRSRGRP